MFFRFLMIGLLAATAAGCGASVDADGKVLTDRVWFDQAGVAHCPHPDCLPTPKLRPTAEETDNSRVQSHRNVCEKGHPVLWAADDVICWNCQGAKSCPTCRGTGLAGKERACGACVAVEEDARVVGTGKCTECAGKGTIRYGGTVLAPH
jgi:hypothetical protein